MKYVKLDYALSLIRLESKPEAMMSVTEKCICQALRNNAVDAVEVTRCHACRFGMKSQHMPYRRCVCPNMPQRVVQDDGFCNFGIPKGGE